MAQSLPLPVWDRRANRVFQEWMDDHKSTYESKPRIAVTQWIQSQPIYDWAYALRQNTRRSARLIGPFVRKHKIDMSEFEQVDYESFAAFFVRRFRPGVRTFPSEAGAMGAFAEARYFGWAHLGENQTFPVKGHSLNAERILGSAERARPFVGGPVLLTRLAPVDYHRVHYFDDGQTLESDRIGARLWTVNWRALQNKEDILFSNERHINMLKTKNFGRLAFVEIGAMTVGRTRSFIRSKCRSAAVRKRRCSSSAAPRSSCSARRAAGFPPRTSCITQSRGSRQLVRLGEPVATRRSDHGAQ